MDLQFIDNSAINYGQRKLIRSHVMKGRNAGRTLQSRRRRRCKSAPEPPLVPPSADDIQDDMEKVTEDVGAVTRLTRTVGHELSCLSLASNLTPETAALVRRCKPQLSVLDGGLLCTRIRRLEVAHAVVLLLVYSFVSQTIFLPVFCLPKNVTGSVWIQYMFVDEAYLNAFIATSAASLQFLHTLAVVESPLGIRHLSRAVSIINHRLSSRDSLSDRTVAVIVSMTMHERLCGRYQNALVHLAGLYRIVELRGGISKLFSNRTLAQRVCRADIDLALHYGTSTKFRGEDLPASGVLFELRRQFTPTPHPATSLLCAQVSQGLRDILEDVLWLTSVLNDSDISLRVDIYSLDDMTRLFCYRLIEFSTLRCSPALSGNIEWACHLGLTAILTTFPLELGRPMVTLHLLRDLLRAAVCTIPAREDIGVRPFHLWLLFAGGISVLADADEQSWLLPEIALAAGSLDVRSWPAAQEVLARFPWIKAIHGRPGHLLWEAATRHPGRAIDPSRMLQSRAQR